MTVTSDPGPDVTGWDDDGGGDWYGESAPRAVARHGREASAWIRHAPAERAPVAGVPAVWAAAEIMHAVGVSPWFTGAAALAAAVAAGWLGERHTRVEAERAAHEMAAVRASARPRLSAAELAAAAAGVGAWVVAAVRWGPLAGPFDLLTLLYVASAACGYWWLRTHEAVRAARRRRDDYAAELARLAAEARAWDEKCTQWHRLAVALGISHGERSHLMEWEQTPLGERWLVKTTGTGQRASSLAGRDLAERLAELGGKLDGTGWPLPPGRVEVTPGRLAGEIWFSVRSAGDPWASPIWHPMHTGALDAAAPYANLIPAAPDALTPVPLGVDPETGAPMLLPMFERGAGARHVGVFATTGGGKTMLLDTCRVQWAMSPDVRFFQINLRKPRAERKWTGVAEGSALAGDPDAAGRARAILGYLAGVIEVRSGADAAADDRYHQPTPEAPHYIGIIDEIAAAAADPVIKACIEIIERTGRENAVSLLVAGQRPVQREIGGMVVRANTTFYVYGAMISTDRRRGSGSDEIRLPDMGSYGEGAPGVFGVARMNAGSASLTGRGRTLFWGDDTAGLKRVIAALAAAHVPHTPEPAVQARPDLMKLWQAATGGAMPEGDAYDVTRTGGGQAVRGTAGVRGKLAAAAGLLSGTPAAPPAVDTALLARPGAQRPAGGPGQPAGPVPAPGPPVAAMAAMRTARAMLARPGGVTAAALAEAVGCGKTKAWELLNELARQRAAVVVGAGRAARFEAPRPGIRGPRLLAAVPDDLTADDGFDGGDQGDTSSDLAEPDDDDDEDEDDLAEPDDGLDGDDAGVWQ